MSPPAAGPSGHGSTDSERDGIQVSHSKRPAASGKDKGTNRDAIKRRFSRACRTCRARKVRCDVTVRGSPCTNCRLDHGECVVLTSKRGPKPRPKPPPAQPQAGPPPLPSGSPCPSSRGIQETGQLAASEGQEATARVDDGYEQASVAPMILTPSSHHQSISQSEPVHPPSHTDRAETPTDRIHEVAVGLTFNHEDDENGGPDAEICHSDPPATGDCASSFVDSPPSDGGCSLPAFIRPLPNSLPHLDLVYLQQKGALVLPRPTDRDEILRSYLATIHPMMPILDVTPFLRSVASNGSNGQVGLLLFQAVMFAGLSALSEASVKNMGFVDTKQARAAFFSRARALHNLEIEPDRTSLLQALLLMSLWYGGRKERRNTWYYVGLAHSLAQHMGLHRELESYKTYDHDHRLRRRLWWSLLIRDRLMALGTRHPSRIREDDYEVGMLAEVDFDLGPWDDSIAHYFVYEGAMQFHDEARCLALLCIELAKLCISIGQVLTAQYTVFGTRSRWTRSLMVIPRQDLDEAATSICIERQEHELAKWDEALHPDIGGALRGSTQPLGQWTQWHGSVIQMIRLTLLSLMYRPPTLRSPASNKEQAKTVNITTISRSKLKAAARDLTRLTHMIVLQDRVRYLPTSGVPILLSAGMTHMLDLEASDDDTRDAAIYRLKEIMQAFKALRGIYASADSAVEYLGLIVRRTGLGRRIAEVSSLAPEFSDMFWPLRPSSKDLKGPHGTPGMAKTTRPVATNGTIGSGAGQETSKSVDFSFLTPPNGASAISDYAMPNTDQPRPINPNNMGTGTSNGMTQLGMSEFQPAGPSSLSTNGMSGLADLNMGHRLLNGSLFDDEIFDPLGSLDYDLGADIFSTQLNSTDDNMRWFDSVSGNH